MITIRTKAGLIQACLIILLAMPVLFCSCSGGFFSSFSDNRSTSVKLPPQVSQLPAASLEIKTFEGQPKRIKLGETTTLSWDIAGATSFTIDPPIGIVSGSTGSAVITPTGTTLYTLKATDGNNEATARFLVITESNEGSILWQTPKTDNSTELLPPEGWAFYPNNNVSWVIRDSYKYPYTEDTELCVQIGTIVNNSNNWTMTDVTLDKTKIADSILPGQTNMYSTSVNCQFYTLKWKWQVRH
jgi:hypothetical protein